MPSIESTVTDDEQELENDNRYDIDQINLQTYEAPEDKKSKTADSTTSETDDDDVQDEEPENNMDDIEADYDYQLERFPEDYRFTTKMVALMCEMKSQDVRNHLKYWDAVLQVERDKNNRASWSKDKIRKFQEMLDVKRTRNFTIEKVLDYYLAPVGEDSTQLSNTGDTPNALAIEAFTRAITGSFAKNLEETKKELTDQNAQLQKLVAEKDQRDKEAFESILGRLDQITKDAEAKEKELAELKAENASLQEKLNEATEKKSFWGLFKKNQ